MLNEDLHLQRGIEDIGEVKETREFLFTSDDPFVALIRQLNETEAQPVASVEEFETLREHILVDVSRAEKMSPLFQYLREILQPMDFDDVKDNLMELLYNAWEHGSQYCEQGDVNVRIYLGKEKRILISVEQPGAGFDYKKVFAEAEDAERPGMAARGGGMDKIRSSSEDAAFGFEHAVENEQQRFRALLSQRLYEK